jgi:hypothetical protein
MLGLWATWSKHMQAWGARSSKEILASDVGHHGATRWYGLRDFLSVPGNTSALGSSLCPPCKSSKHNHWGAWERRDAARRCEGHRTGMCHCVPGVRRKKMRP